MYEEYVISRYQWIYDQQQDLVGLEQFAITISALAHGHTNPHHVMKNVLAILAENLNAARGTCNYTPENILREKATAYGFEDIDFFRQCLIEQIRKSILDLQMSQMGVCGSISDKAA